jgi:hypothetical protein
MILSLTSINFVKIIQLLVIFVCMSPLCNYPLRFLCVRVISKESRRNKSSDRNIVYMSRNGSVGIATGYGLDGRSSISHNG